MFAFGILKLQSETLGNNLKPKEYLSKCLGTGCRHP